MKPRYDTVFFDLDGTITDSAPGILASVRYALGKFRGETAAVKEDYSDAELNFFIGPPLVDSFRKLLGCDEAAANRCVAWYREYYTGASPSSHLPGMLLNRVYPGVEEALVILRANGVKICLATAKPEPYARRILDHFGLSRHFDFIHGATLDETRNRKAQVIAWALGHSGAVGSAVMVGDRADDVKGAAANGLETVGALWGYGGERELVEAGAKALADDIPGAVKFILQGTV